MIKNKSAALEQLMGDFEMRMGFKGLRAIVAVKLERIVLGRIKKCSLNTNKLTIKVSPLYSGTVYIRITVGEDLYSV